MAADRLRRRSLKRKALNQSDQHTDQSKVPRIANRQLTRRGFSTMSDKGSDVIDRREALQSHPIKNRNMDTAEDKPATTKPLEDENPSHTADKIQSSRVPDPSSEECPVPDSTDDLLPLNTHKENTDQSKPEQNVSSSDTTRKDISEDTTPDSVPPTGPFRYKSPPKSMKEAGCAENTWTAERKKQRTERIKKSRLFRDVPEQMWPLIYSKDYDISFYGLQKVHPFDSGKWGRICENLKKSIMPIRDEHIVEPCMPDDDDLLVVHSQRYLKTLEDNNTIAHVTEIPAVAFYLFSNSKIQSKVLNPLKLQTGGTVLAADLAMKRGWAINIGGGFHHCCAEMGGGFCAFADITIALKFLFERGDNVKKAMIVDLDAHQGNGHERDFMDDDRVYIMDVYNSDIYPRDSYAKAAISKKVPIHCGIGDADYLPLVETKLKESLSECSPDIIVYNAGTDILEGDPLGKMNVTAEGITKRDEIVFREAKERHIPIVMVTSGGYQKKTAEVVSNSIINLYDKGYITAPTAESDVPQKQIAEKAPSYYDWVSPYFPWEWECTIM